MLVFSIIFINFETLRDLVFMPYTYLLELVASSALATTCFICSRLLWIAQAKRASRSTRLLGIASLFCGITTVGALASSIFLVHPTDGIPLLNPWIGLMYLCLHTVMVVYPISAVKEDWLTSKHFFFLFLPSLLLAIMFLFFQGRWTPLYAWEDFVNNLGRADVLVRAFSQLLIIPYCFIPFIVPYNYLRSSASARWINTYSFFSVGALPDSYCSYVHRHSGADDSGFPAVGRLLPVGHPLRDGRPPVPVGTGAEAGDRDEAFPPEGG